jgi:hypothetical protein
VDEPTPNGLRIWDNQARLSLSKGLVLWLACLVLTCLASVLFVRDHIPARWLLSGFVLSHLIVFASPPVFKNTWRIGQVGLLHILCWGPGGIFVLFDVTGSTMRPLNYSIWGSTLTLVLIIAFVFDGRDALTWLRWKSKVGR